MERARFDEFSHLEIIVSELSIIFYDVSIACRRLNVSALEYISGSPASEEDERGWTSVRDRHGFDPIWSSDTAVAHHHWRKYAGGDSKSRGLYRENSAGLG